MKTTHLTTINGIIWSVAGANVIKLGVEAWHIVADTTIWMVLGCIATLAAFAVMFVRMVFKNVRRIRQLPTHKRKAWNCMPLRSFLIMAFMIGLGITLRQSPMVPRTFIAAFYVGLGTALLTAGIIYLSFMLPMPWTKEKAKGGEGKDEK